MLQSDINGNFSEEPKKNEFTIELPSSQLVSGLFDALQTMPGEMEGTIAEQDERISEPEAPSNNFAINAAAGAGGSILPFGAVTVDYGEDQIFTITPDEGYYIIDVVVDGSSIGAVNTCTFYAVTANHTIEAFFTSDTPAPGGIVLLLPMDEGQGPAVYDRSEMGNDGTISGASREQLPSGQWYLSFDGTDDYITSGAVSTFSFTQNTGIFTL